MNFYTQQPNDNKRRAMPALYTNIFILKLKQKVSAVFFTILLQYKLQYC